MPTKASAPLIQLYCYVMTLNVCNMYVLSAKLIQSNFVVDYSFYIGV